MPLIISLWLIVIFFGYAAKAEVIDHSYTDYAYLLDKYVANGLVNYKGLKTDADKLNRLVVAIEEADLSEVDNNRKLTFYINAYNIFTLKSIVDAYPVSSIKDIGGVWDKQKWVVAGEKLTLNQLENKKIRAEYSEPLIHFALVCAALSCPPLSSRPYLPDSLQAQLIAAGKAFVTDEKHNRLDVQEKEAGVSSIFDWYGDDFIQKYYDASIFKQLSKKENAILKFIIGNYPQAERDRLKAIEFEIDYLDYNWSLNEMR